MLEGNEGGAGGRRLGSRRKLSLLALAGSAGVITVACLAAPAGAASERALAPMFERAPVVLGDRALNAAEKLMVLTERNPDRFAGAWPDGTSGRIVAGLAPGARDADRAEAERVARDVGRTAEVPRSYQDLQSIKARVTQSDWSVAGVEITSVGLDIKSNRVVVGLETVTDDARAELAERFGDAVNVRALGRFTNNVERWKDRSPYTGGSGYEQNGTSPLAPAECSTAFAMKMGTAFRMVSAGHCRLASTGTHTFPNISNPASLNGASSSWNNVLFVGQQTNSLASSGSSQAFFGTYYGDILMWNVSAAGSSEGYVWTKAAGDANNGYRTTTKQAVKYTQTGNPAVTTPVCFSGASSGVLCGSGQFTVDSVDQSVNLGGGVIQQPMVLVDVAPGFKCPVGGDSGGAWFRLISGEISASGIHSSTNDASDGTADGFCSAIAYTSISKAQAFYGATTIVVP